MKNSLACLWLALSLTSPALANTLKIPADKPVASITFPKGWNAAVTAEGIAASSEDGGVLINIIPATPTMFGPANDKAFAMLKVKPDFDSWKDTRAKLNGMNIVHTTLDAKKEAGGTVRLTLTGIYLTKDKGVLVILRGEGEAKHQDEITAIMNSIAAAP
jgi:hypothetical protein